MFERILNYANELEPPVDILLPSKTIRWLFPHRQSETRRCMEEFYEKFYSDNDQRILILGINPGRFGGGTTGNKMNFFLFDSKRHRSIDF